MKRRDYALLFLLILLLGMPACGLENQANPTEASDTEASSDTYRLSEEQFTAGGMVLDTFSLRSFQQSIRVNGLFDVPPENKASVSTYFGGYVKQLRLVPGQRIRKGQRLFTLENPDYIHVQQDFLEAKGQLAYLKSDFERQRNLAQDSVAAQKTFLKAEADYQVTKVRYESLKKQLAMMQIDPQTLTEEALQTTIEVVAPISGQITDVHIARGQYLEPSDVAVSIINTDHLHLELAVFEQDLAAVKVGQPIIFHIQNDPDHAYRGSVYLVNPAIDPEKRTAHIHGHLDDEHATESFYPGMYIEAAIQVGATEERALSEAAVVEIDGQHFVLEHLGTDNGSYQFRKRQVTVGPTVGEYVAIRNPDAFSPNAVFLVKGAFGLIAE